MRVLVVSSSLNSASKSRELAIKCSDELCALRCDVSLLDLSVHDLPPFDDEAVYSHPAVQHAWECISKADGVVIASPTYNWGCCAELKRLIELTGSTDSSRGLRGAWFDKVLTFVNSAGLPHSYMAFGSLAVAMMLDYKCVINPYNVCVHSDQWHSGMLSEDAAKRLQKSMAVMKELLTLLSDRTYSSKWEI